MSAAYHSLRPFLAISVALITSFGWPCAEIVVSADQPVYASGGEALDIALVLHMEHGGGNDFLLTTHFVSILGTRSLFCHCMVSSAS